VREGSSLSAKEAAKLGVINFTATNLTDLFKQADRRTVTLAGGERVKLSTMAVSVEEYPMSWRVKFLSIMTNSPYAYVINI
jgi:membrane-bound ClpP family serine protease